MEKRCRQYIRARERLNESGNQASAMSKAACCIRGKDLMNSDPTVQRRLGHRVGRAFTRFTITLVVLALVGTVGFLLSQLNARTFTLEMNGGTLTVLKGRLLPVGSQAYRPSETSLADAYAPLPLDGESLDPSLLQQRFTERDELDRALFDTIQKLAQPRVISDDPAALERGLYYLRRAEKLSGITAEQKMALKRMESDVAYYQARLKLEDARKLVGEALLQLRAASETPNRHTRSANQMITVVEGPARGLEEALRNAVHSLSAPGQDGKGAPASVPATPAAAPGDKPVAAPTDKPAMAPTDKPMAAPGSENPRSSPGSNEAKP
jgi:hypothetical protein